MLLKIIHLSEGEDKNKKYALTDGVHVLGFHNSFHNRAFADLSVTPEKARAMGKYFSGTHGEPENKEIGYKTYAMDIVKIPIGDFLNSLQLNHGFWELVGIE